MKSILCPIRLHQVPAAPPRCGAYSKSLHFTITKSLGVSNYTILCPPYNLHARYECNPNLSKQHQQCYTPFSKTPNLLRVTDQTNIQPRRTIRDIQPPSQTREISNSRLTPRNIQHLLTLSVLHHLLIHLHALLLHLRRLLLHHFLS